MITTLDQLAEIERKAARDKSKRQYWASPEARERKKARVRAYKAANPEKAAASRRAAYLRAKVGTQRQYTKTAHPSGDASAT
jgi:hypothetical protein